ncbi:MAG TPA: alpha-L-fucosidase [Opitutaceae bacterium]|jgi:alpha-L-fucosidase
MKRFCFALLVLFGAMNRLAAEPRLTANQIDFMSWGFGMFVHFNLGTVVDNDWAGGYEDTGLFHPNHLDCGEWADAAKAAGMKYMVLTVKHTEGIVLYPSVVTDRDTRLFRNFRNRRGDIVADFMAACRSRGLKAGLYYCMPGDYSDAAHHNAPPPGKPNLHGMPPEAAGDFAAFAERQLTEMLTRYHPDLLWVDQYANRYTGSRWPEVLAAIRKAAPDCIVVANNARALGPTDVLSYEFPWKGDLPPIGNGEPAEVCDTIQTGARWFWRRSNAPGDLRPAAEIVSRLKQCEARHANYLLDVPPDPDGLISGPQLERLREVAKLLGR